MRKGAVLVGIHFFFIASFFARPAVAQVPSKVYSTACANSNALNGSPWSGVTPPYDYNCPLDSNAMIAGNTLLVSLGFDNSGANQTWSVTDAQGDTFTQIAASTTLNNKKLVVFEATNIKGGESMIDVRLTGGQFNGYWQPTIAEFYNATALDATSCNTGTSNSITAGTLSPTVTGDLLYQVSYYPNLSYGTAGQTGAFVAGSQSNITWALWFELLGDGAGGQWGVYNSTSAINPTFTSNASASFISCAVALKAASAGGPYSSATRVNGIEHDALPKNGSNPWNMAANITGHTVYVTYLDNDAPSPTTCCAISSTPALSWTQSGADGVGLNGHNHTDVYCATSANPIGPIQFKFQRSGNTNDAIFMIYDVDGWGCNLDADSGVLSGNYTTNNTLPFCSNCLTPTTPNDFILGNFGEYACTAVGINSSASWNSIDDAGYFTGNTVDGYTQTDENNGFFHGTNGSNLAAISMKWNDVCTGLAPYPGYWAGRVAAYKPTSSAGLQPPTGLTAIVH